MLPTAFLNMLQGLPGFNKENFMQVHERGEQVTSLRMNPIKKFDLGQHRFLHKTTPIPWCRHGFYIQDRPSFVLDPLWHAGAYYVQEASSMFVQFILEQIMPTPNGKVVLDLCAAPGGKTTLLASYFENGLVVANETIKARNSILVENVTKWGSDKVIVTQNDPAHFKALPQFFDLMLVDAPCSGSGLFRKDPAAIEEWSQEAVLHCSNRQLRILEDSLPALNEGGYLIYSTCSYSFEEDEKIMDAIASMDGMQNISLPLTVEWNIVPTESPLHKATGYRFYPDKVKGEGFFITVFQKKANTQNRYFSADFKWDLINKQAKSVLATHFQFPEHYLYINHQNTIIAIPVFLEEGIRAVLKNLYVKKVGVEIGTIKGKDLIPAHALAMSHWLHIPFGHFEVDEATALQFLRRSDLFFDCAKGWQAVCFQNIRLGWAKILPNRTNNYYPTHWRILNY